MIKDKKIAIIGGGMGGLILTRLLQLQGIDVVVYERDRDRYARQQGATLDLHEDTGLKAMERAKLLNEFYAKFRPDAGKLRIVDGQGEIHSDDHQNDGAGVDVRPEIDRLPLRNILIDALPQNTIIWDRHFISMIRELDGWRMHFKNDHVAYADIVIGADGANSKIRPYLSDIKRVFSGITIIEGSVNDPAKNAPRLWELVKNGKIFALNNQQSIILSAKGDGSLSFYTGCKTPENWLAKSGIDFNHKPQVFDWFKTEFDTWGDIWSELFSGDEGWFEVRPQYHYPLNQSWVSMPNLTMLGDAAHLMPPYAGEGVNQAMQDAFELAECLTGNRFPNIQTAIASFEKRMLLRTSETTQVTLDSMEMMHSENGLKKLVDVFSEIKA